MSRETASRARKAGQKEAMAAKKEEHDRLAALGMTGAIKKQIGADVLLCTQCGATTLGPLTKCECKGGRCKPGDGECPMAWLIAAAKARHALGVEASMAAAAKQQSAVQQGRAKKKAAQGAVDIFEDDEIIIQGDGVEMITMVEFPAGKLGMGLEKNSVSSIGDAPSPALDGGVKRGWVLHMVEGKVVGKDKKAIAKAVALAMKANPTIKIGFRVPCTDGFHHCTACDKFMEGDNFDEAQLDEGPGKQMCCSCEEYAGMGFD